MNNHVPRLAALLAMVLGVALLMAAPALASPSAQFSDPVEQGKYLTEIAGCWGCHTPRDPETFQVYEGRDFSGGEVFDLGPLGQVQSKNLTSDPATGLGDWSDEEIITAVTTGVSRDGLHLFPVMPYSTFSGMAQDDLAAVVAYLRTLDPIENTVPRVQVLPVEAMPVISYRGPAEAPDPADTEARGRYLFSGVLACTDCHTPVDPDTGAPEMDKFLAGGQPYEGPWGTVYGGNITPDQETGIGDWTDAEIERVLREGIRPDGRVVVLMPVEDYEFLTDEDVAAVIWYLRNEVQPVNREVPAAALNDAFVHVVEVPQEESAGSNLPTGLILGVTGAIVVVVIGAVVVMTRKPDLPASGG